MAALIHEHHALIRTPAGVAYVPRTYGAQQAEAPGRRGDNCWSPCRFSADEPLGMQYF